MEHDADKRAAAEYAAGMVPPQSVIGLGSGSTAALLIDALGNRVAHGLIILGIPTSEHTAARARLRGIPLSTLDDHPMLDLTIDGADEVDPHLNLIKGGGGALLREKIVAAASRLYVTIVDRSKRVEHLGTHMPVPVEVVRFGWPTTERRLEALGLECHLRQVGQQPFVTDGGHYILDCTSHRLNFADPAVAAAIKMTIGVVEHGLFLRMSDEVIVGQEGGVQILRRSGHEGDYPLS